MPLYLVRHPRPLGHEGRCYGRTELGVAEADVESALAGVRSRIDARALEHGVIVSSPAQRCRALAERLAGARRIEIAEELRELDFGAWEGRLWEEIPRLELDAWARDPWQHRPGGVESAALLAARYARWRARMGAHDAPVIAVTHAGLIRMALLEAGRLDRTGLLSVAIPFGSVHVLEDPCAP